MFETEEAKQYHNVTGELAYVFNTTNLGQLHWILVTAELEDLHSSNVLPSKVKASETSPRIREGVDVKGVFVPTSNLDISLDVENTTATSLVDAGEIAFSGLLLPNHQNLTVGDFISGFTTIGDPFLLNVTAVVLSNNTDVILEVVTLSLEAIYEEADFEFSIAASRDRNDTASYGTSRRSRELVLRSYHRRLGFWSKVGNFITDAVNGIVDTITDILTFDISKTFEIFQIRPSFDIDVTSNIDWSGFVGVRSDLIFTLKIGAQNEASAELSLSYSMETRVTIDAAATLADWKDDKTLWEGKKKCKVFMAGKIPVIVHYQPKVDFEAGLSLEASGSAVASVSGSGGSSVSAAVTTSGINTDVVPISFTPESSFDATAKVSLEAFADLIFRGEVEIYGGLLTANAGLKLGAGLDATVALFQIEPGELRQMVIVLEKLDFLFRYGIPLSVGSVLVDEEDWLSTEIFKGTKKILTLPEAEFDLGGHICEINEETDNREGKVVKIEVKEKAVVADPPLLPNGFSTTHDVQWWVGGDYHDNSWAITQIGRYNIFISRSVNPLNVSPAQNGPVFAAVVPSFPGIALLPVMYQVQLDIPEVPCVNSPSESPSDVPSSSPSTPIPSPYPSTAQPTTESPTCENQLYGRACGGKSLNALFWNCTLK